MISDLDFLIVFLCLCVCVPLPVAMSASQAISLWLSHIMSLVIYMYILVHVYVYLWVRADDRPLNALINVFTDPSYCVLCIAGAFIRNNGIISVSI